MGNMSEKELIGMISNLTREELLESLGNYYESAGLTKAVIKLEGHSMEELRKLYIMNIYEEESIPF